MRKISTWLLGASFLCACAAYAQDRFPSKPIEVIVTATAGSQADTLARFLGHEVAQRLGQQIVVVNQANATGTIGTRAVRRAAPDGYTLLLGGNTTMAANVHMLTDPGYDPVRDFEPVALITINPLVLVVRSELPVASVNDLITYAKARAGQLNYGVGNSGNKVAAGLFQSLTGVQATEISFRGASHAMRELIAGRLDFMFSDPLVAEPFIKEGILRALAVTSATKPPSMTQLPTMDEAGVSGFQEVVSFLGYYAPKGTPASAIQRLNQALVSAINSQQGQTQYQKMGLVPKTSTPDQLATFTREQIAVWKHLVQVSGIEPQ